MFIPKMRRARIDQAHPGPMGLTSIICLLLLISQPATAQDSPFSAKVKAVDLLDSTEVIEQIADCTRNADPPPAHVDLEISLDNQGKLVAVNLAPVLPDATRSCIQRALEAIEFPILEEGYTVTHRIKPDHRDQASEEGSSDAPKEDIKEPEEAVSSPVQKAFHDPDPSRKEPEEAGPPPEQKPFNDPDPSRIVYAQTAIPREKGVFDATIHNLGYWVLEYGFHENVALGLKFILPIGYLAFTPNLRAGFQINDHFWLGGSVNLTYLTSYIEDFGSDYFISYGGTFSLSAGSDQILFNFALTAQGVHLSSLNDIEGFFLPQFGTSIRLHEKVKLNLEIAPPLATDAGFMKDSGGRVWILMYGFRIHGDSIYGDISFVWPAFEGAWEIMRYVPIGFPMLSFGFQAGGKE